MSFVGTLIADKYRVENNIDSGGNAVIWKVTNGSGNEYALKLLKGPYNEKFAKKYSRFKAEVEIVLSVQSSIEGILPIYDYHLPETPSGKDIPWYVMPIAIPIDEVCDSQKDFDKIINGVISLSITLSKLHEREIVHRDIKPRNLYLFDNKWCFGDFGLVDYPEKADITTKKESVGAKWTIAPEMKRESEVADGKSADVYSLAKTLWILLTGVATGFEGQYDDQIEKIRLRDYFPQEHLIELNELLRAATDNNPAKRPFSEDFTDAMVEWLEIRDDFSKRNLSQWKYVQNSLFGNAVPELTEWRQIGKIIEVLNLLGSMPSLNHMFFPDGGGLDFTSAKYAGEFGCIKMYFSGFGAPYIVKPKKLTFVNIQDDYLWNYFRLESDKLDAIEADSSDRKIEYLTEYTAGTYISWKYGNYGYYQGQPLPETSQLVYRVLEGDFVIFSKGSIYNDIPSTYDARHDKLGTDGFREHVIKLRYAYHYCLEHKEEIREKGKREQEQKDLENQPKREEYLAKKASYIEEARKNPIENNLVEILSGVGKTSSIDSMQYYILICFFGDFTLKDQWVLLQDYLLLKIDEANNRNLPNNAYTINNFADAERITRLLSEVLKQPEGDVSKFLGLKATIIKKRVRPPKHLFTENEIKQVLIAGNDEIHNTLVVDLEGYVRLIPRDQYDEVSLEQFAVRNESYVAYNNYVGKYSSLSHLGEEYLNCLEAWVKHLKTDKTVYTDGNWDPKTAEEYIEEIEKLIIEKYKE